MYKEKENAKGGVSKKEEKRSSAKKKRSVSPTLGYSTTEAKECIVKDEECDKDEDEADDCGIDVSLYSRQLYVLGAEQEEQKQQSASTKPKPLVVNAHMRPLDRVVQLQQFDGSWFSLKIL